MSTADVLTIEESFLSKPLDGASRQDLLDFESLILEQEGSIKGTKNPECPLTHTFSDGIYVRQIEIPAGMFVTGRIHKHDHPNFLLKGEVLVITESGREHLVAPVSMISKPGTKRALYSITDLVWTTVHLNPTNTQDIDELELMLSAENYEEYDKYVHDKGSIVKRLKRSLIKLLSI